MVMQHKSVNLNEKSVNLHMLEDVLGWIAVLIGALFIKITGWNRIDPLLSLVISIIIGIKAFKNILDIVKVIAEATPKDIDIKTLTEEIKTISGIIDVHHIHVWSLDGNENFLTMHVQISKTLPKKNYDILKEKVKEMLREKNISHSTIEIEYEECKEENCS